MKRRQLVTLAAFGAAGAASPGHAERKAVLPQGPTLLTLSGSIGQANRGRLDPALDQLMHKQQVRFEKAYCFDFPSLLALPSVTIRPTLEYDRKPHRLSGPLLVDVLQACGTSSPSPRTRLLMRAIDGYAVTLPLAQIRQQRFIVATHLDGQAMALGGLGPLWAVYDADRVPEMAARPLQERFASCPWGLYHIEVQTG